MPRTERLSRPARRGLLVATASLLAATAVQGAVNSVAPIHLQTSGLIVFHAALLAFFVAALARERRTGEALPLAFALLAAQPVIVLITIGPAASALSVLPFGALPVLVALRCPPPATETTGAADVGRSHRTPVRRLVPAAAIIAACASALVWCSAGCHWGLVATAVLKITAFAAAFLSIAVGPWGSSSRWALTAAVPLLPAGIAAMAAATGRLDHLTAHWASAVTDIWVCGAYAIAEILGPEEPRRPGDTPRPLPPRRSADTAIPASVDGPPASSERSNSCSEGTRSSSPAHLSYSNVPERLSAPY